MPLIRTPPRASKQTLPRRVARSVRSTNVEEAIRQGKPEVVDPAALTDFGQLLMKARWDVNYFAEAVLGITAHPGQSRLFDAYLKRNETGWRPRYLDINLAAGNRAGKTLGLTIVILHATLFKMGSEPPDPSDVKAVVRWQKADYLWFHFAVSYETSVIVYQEVVRILSGTHPAQKDGCPMTKMLGLMAADWKTKYRSEFLQVVWHPALGGGVIHFRTTGEKAIGSLGKEMHGISFDEAAFEPAFDFVINEVLHLRRLGTGGQLVLAGTMTEGLTDYADRWELGNRENPDYLDDAFSLRMSTRENVGFGIPPDIFDRLIAGVPAHLVAQNIDGYAVEKTNSFFSSLTVNSVFDEELSEEVPLLNSHHYVQGVDLALTQDATWSIVLDITNGERWVGVRAERKTGRQTAASIVNLVALTHASYNDPMRRASCHTAIDSTGFGGHIFRDLIPFNVKAVEFGGTRKAKYRLLTELKRRVETGGLVMPRRGIWLKLRRQLLGYVLYDRAISQDGVMALAIAVEVARRNPGRMAKEVPFEYFGSSSGPDAVLSGPELLARLRLMKGS